MKFALKHLFESGSFLLEETFVCFGFVPDLLAQVNGWVVVELYIEFVDLLFEDLRNWLYHFFDAFW